MESMMDVSGKFYIPKKSKVAVALFADTDPKNIAGRMATDILYMNLMKRGYKLSQTDRENLSKAAFKASDKALWKNLVSEYLTAYSTALEKVTERQDAIINQPQTRPQISVINKQGESPLWRKFEIQTTMPERFSCLIGMSLNQWWTWNYSASEMFKYINPEGNKMKYKTAIINAFLSCII
jgi:phosphorylase/glycogen(starch) synthase